MTIEHHHRVDLFMNVIDYQLKQLNSRFGGLLILSTALNPTNGYQSFSVNDICKLVQKFYPSDFSAQEKIQSEYELQHYKLGVPCHPPVQYLSTIAKLCQELVKTEKFEIYPLIDSYSDSDWGRCTDDCKSTYGCLFMFGSGACSWMTKKQEVVAQSTAETEYMWHLQQPRIRPFG
ncbi:zinc finger MYM-type protein 1-like [Senna tora]|uniref:Zinc finger MYM-type protein 1-like n=1 Tax=Senna tora TaxID=362788 RepID=A0A834W6G8_9FABA|nr:zinc finger MYM-type protein 1-like [Senna tora]